MSLQGLGQQAESSKRGLWYLCCCGDDPISPEPELARPEPEPGVSAAKAAPKPSPPAGTTVSKSALLSDDGICLAFERGSPATHGRAVPAVAGDGPDGPTPPAVSLASWIANTAIDAGSARLGMGSRGAPQTVSGGARAGGEGGGGGGGVRARSDPGSGMLGGRRSAGAAGEGTVSTLTAASTAGAVAGAAAAAAGASLVSLVHGPTRHRPSQQPSVPAMASGAAMDHGAPSGGPVTDDSAQEAWPCRSSGAWVQGQGAINQLGLEGGGGRSGSGSDAEGGSNGAGHKLSSGTRGAWGSGLAERVGALAGAQAGELIRVQPSRAVGGGAHGPSAPGGGGGGSANRRVAGPVHTEAVPFWAVGSTQQAALDLMDSAEMFVEGLPK
ncbi:hypothetical protein HYH03_011761 [Edaphochlamys debaryana]|uniref:Uncharacterized protein n=1 Tax=Edaphochlamys debaryana TaxID=47281 RepID=A0A835XRG6_9CHLO|nr:hypothetical protein HYH03_011761 [Edaphochlamys debaryana]|eukprot:KAG2489812.1 hypothetical protein HYH03_011761 [Edaphochlamys debaryana]